MARKKTFRVDQQLLALAFFYCFTAGWSFAAVACSIVNHFIHSKGKNVLGLEFHIVFFGAFKNWSGNFIFIDTELRIHFGSWPE